MRLKRTAIGLFVLSFALAPARAAAPKGSAAASSSKKSSASKNKKSAKKKTPPAPKKPPPFGCAALPWQPRLLSTRIVRDGTDLAIVTQDLLVSGKAPDKSAGKPEDGRLFVSFGAPGVPLSMRVEFAGLHDGELTFPGHVEGRIRALVYQQAPENDGGCTVLGRSRESGVLIQVPRDLSVDASTGLGVLRIEQTVQLGTLADGRRDLVLRLASFGDAPVRLGPVASKDPAQLELCAHGQAPVPIEGSPLFQTTTPQQNLCVLLGKR